MRNNTYTLPDLFVHATGDGKIMKAQAHSLAADCHLFPDLQYSRMLSQHHQLLVALTTPVTRGDSGLFSGSLLGSGPFKTLTAASAADSIMNPEAPLALRLSGQLLLGVVKVHSKKVGYLFQDCNDALSKIKQVRGCGAQL